MLMGPPRGGGRATPRTCELQLVDLMQASLYTTAPTLQAPESVGGRSVGWVGGGSIGSIFHGLDPPPPPRGGGGGSTLHPMHVLLSAIHDQDVRLLLLLPHGSLMATSLTM